MKVVAAVLPVVVAPGAIETASVAPSCQGDSESEDHESNSATGHSSNARDDSHATVEITARFGNRATGETTYVGPLHAYWPARR